MEQYGGKGNEKWYQSRRLYAAILSVGTAIAVYFAPEQYDLVISAASAISATFGITSWVKPTKVKAKLEPKS